MVNHLGQFYFGCGIGPDNIQRSFQSKLLYASPIHALTNTTKETEHQSSSLLL